MSDHIPWEAAEKFATEHGCNLAVILAWSAEDNTSHVVTWGDLPERSDFAAERGNRIKELLGWPKSLRATSPKVQALVDSTAELVDRVMVLEAVIRKHRDQRGDERCWLDDHELYAALGEPVPLDATALPPREDFLESCRRYYEQRRCPLDVYPPGRMRIAELEAQVERLQGIIGNALC